MKCYFPCAASRPLLEPARQECDGQVSDRKHWSSAALIRVIRDAFVKL